MPPFKTVFKKKQIKLAYRPDIDGLRAIAVTLVLFYHAEISYLNNTIFSAGFIGVDIFFVISGYLISLLILKEFERTKEFSFAYFYERRARRILPALFFVMALSFPLAWTYLMPENFIDYSKSVILSIFFNSNFYFHYSGLVYGSPDSLLKPFLHTWSLSVEEQFYIIFPILTIILLKYFKKFLFQILIIIFLISLGLAEWGSRNYPSETFYFLHSRMWELLAGSLLALLEIKKKFQNRSILIGNILSLFGIFLIIVYLLFYNENFNHPSLLTLIPVIGTCLIIWSKTKKNIVTYILSSRPFVGVGLISYSLYLWHYPIFAFARTKDSTPSEYDKFEWIVLTLILSIITYFIVERVFKNRVAFSFKKFLIYLSSLAIIIVSFNFYVILNDGFNYKYKINQNFSLDNSIYKKEWLEFRKKIGTPDFYENKKIKVLIIGNSHGNDTFNMFYLNKDLFKKHEFSIVDVHVSCFYLFLKDKNSLPTYCKNSFKNKDLKHVEKIFYKSDIVILSTKWLDEDIEILSPFTKRLIDERKKILLFSNTLEINTKIRRNFHILDFFVLNNKRLPNENELEKIEKKTFEQLNNTKKINQTLKNIAETNNIQMLFKEDYLCDFKSKRCEVLTPNKIKISWDHSHYTLDGAKYLGKRIFEKNWFKY